MKERLRPKKEEVLKYPFVTKTNYLRTAVLFTVSTSQPQPAIKLVCDISCQPAFSNGISFSESRDFRFLKNSDGLSPVTFLKASANVVRLLKPDSSAIASNVLYLYS